MIYHTHTFPNGLRIIHYPTNKQVAHCGLFINAGSRDELEHEKGIAHFVEHLIFKGTKKRKAFHILSRMDDVGGEINAYTGKEETCIHTSFLKNDYERSLELMADITFHSVFPGPEIKKEKEVIIDEINSYKDSPSELIFDDFEEMVFHSKGLGSNILGDPKLLKQFTPSDFKTFTQRNYLPNRMVLSSVGNIHFEKLVRLIDRYFGQIPSPAAEKRRSHSFSYTPEKKQVEKNTNQAHCILGNLAYGMHHEKRIAMALLDNIIGGPGLNNRLNMALREKLGYVYHIESNYTAFSDTGLFSVYFGTDAKRLDKTLHHIHKEFEKLRHQKLGKIQLSKAKKQLFGQIAIGAENQASLMLSIGKSFLFTNRADSLEEIHQMIEEIKAEDIQEIASEILNPDKLSTLIYV